MEEASSIEQLSKNACFLHGLLEVLQPLNQPPSCQKLGVYRPKTTPNHVKILFLTRQSSSIINAPRVVQKV